MKFAQLHISMVSKIIQMSNNYIKFTGGFHQDAHSKSVFLQNFSRKSGAKWFKGIPFEASPVFPFFPNLLCWFTLEISTSALEQLLNILINLRYRLSEYDILDVCSLTCIVGYFLPNISKHRVQNQDTDFAEWHFWGNCHWQHINHWNSSRCRILIRMMAHKFVNNTIIYIYISIYQVLPSDPFGDFKWPFQGWIFDLRLGYQKVTWKKLVQR